MKGIVGQNGFGDGSTATSRKPFVFLVTDGMQNGQHFFTSSNGKYAYPATRRSFPAMPTHGGTARSRRRSIPRTATP